MAYKLALKLKKPTLLLYKKGELVDKQAIVKKGNQSLVRRKYSG